MKIQLRRLFNFKSGNGFKDELQGRSEGDFGFYKVSDINGLTKFAAKPVNYVSGADVDKHRFTVIPPGAIVTAKIGAALSKNHRKVLQEYSIIDNNMLAFIPNSSVIDENYAYWLLKDIDLKDYENISSVPSVNMSQLKQATINVVSGSKQRRIADFLDKETAKIDNLIAKQERLLELLEEKRRATITHAVTRGLDPNVELKETNIPWLGKIPATASVKKLKSVLQLNTGGTWGSDPVGDDSDTVVLRSTEQRMDGAWIIDSPATRQVSVSEYEKTKLISGDLVVTKSSGSALHIGKTSIVDESTEGFSYSNFMQRLRLKRGEHPKFYWYLLNSNLAREQYNYYSNSTSGLANLNSTIFDELQFAHFDPVDQLAIANHLDYENMKFIKLKQKIQTQITLLRERRTSLISHAVTGKIRV